MEIIKTNSFELATISMGYKNADRIAVALPGRLDTKDYVNFLSHLDFLANKGFYAISFDPPGTWKSPGGIELFTTTNYIKAVREVIDNFGNKPTLLIGHSRGGATASLAGYNHPNVVALITINESLGAPSPPDPKRIIGNKHLDFRDLPPGDRKTEKQRKFEMSLEYFKDGAKYNDADVLKNCTKPKLLFYSNRDEFHSPDEVQEIFKQIAEPKMFYQLNSTHDYRYYPEAINEVNKVMGEFIDKYITQFRKLHSN